MENLVWILELLMRIQEILMWILVWNLEIIVWTLGGSSAGPRMMQEVFAKVLEKELKTPAALSRRSRSYTPCMWFTNYGPW